MNILEKAAEILVEDGYALTYAKCPEYRVDIGHALTIPVEPFFDNLEGRRQADAIEDWLRDVQREVWHKIVFSHPPFAPYYKWRLEIIEDSLTELSK